MTVLRVALAQLNPTVGDIDGNLAKLLDAYDQADAAGCDIIAFPELSITGYPPEDLVMKPGFVADNEAALGKLAARTRRCAAVVGFVDEDRDLFNAAAVCAGGEVLGTYRKRLLPNYAVFDEARYFTPGNETDPLELYVIGGVKVGISDLRGHLEPGRPARRCRPTAAPSWPSTSTARRTTAARPPTASRCWRRVPPTPTRRSSTSTRSAARTSSSSTAARWRSTPRATCIARGPQFVEALLIVDVPVPAVYRQRLLDPRGRDLAGVAAADRRVRGAGAARRRRSPTTVVELLSPEAELYQALVLGTRDYCAQERLHRRRDRRCPAASTRRSSPSSPPTRSASDHVHGVSMPSRYSSDHSKSRRRPARREPRPRLPHDHASSRRSAAYLDMLAPTLRGPAARA